MYKTKEVLYTLYPDYKAGLTGCGAVSTVSAYHGNKVGVL